MCAHSMFIAFLCGARFCAKAVHELTANEPSEASGTRALNVFMKLLYCSDFWLCGTRCADVISAGEHFLAASARVAKLSFEMGESRFAITPKFHMLFHIVKHVSWQFDVATFAMNPILESCAMDEDHVGRVARLARSVSPRGVCSRTLQRYLLQLQEVWHMQAD